MKNVFLNWEENPGSIRLIGDSCSKQHERGGQNEEIPVDAAGCDADADDAARDGG